MVGSLKTNVKFSTEYWMRLATIAMFGWTTTVEHSPGANTPGIGSSATGAAAAGTPLSRRQRQPIKPPTCIRSRI